MFNFKKRELNRRPRKTPASSPIMRVSRLKYSGSILKDNRKNGAAFISLPCTSSGHRDYQYRLSIYEKRTRDSRACMPGVPSQSASREIQMHPRARVRLCMPYKGQCGNVNDGWGVHRAVKSDSVSFCVAAGYQNALGLGRVYGRANVPRVSIGRETRHLNI